MGDTTPSTACIAGGDEPTSERSGLRRGRSVRTRHLLVRLVTGIVGVIAVSGTVNAHGPNGHGGEPVAFAVVVGLPVVAGLGGGVVAIRRVRTAGTTSTGRRTGVALGALLSALGVSFAVSAATTNPPLGAAGGFVGMLSGLWFARGARGGRRGCHADLALGAVSAHRLLEGVALGTLYSAGVAVGFVGAAILAGHTALETAAVGGTYAAGPLQTRAAGAVVLVQVGYVGGALAGLGVAAVLPSEARTIALALAGGALVTVGAGEIVRAIVSG